MHQDTRLREKLSSGEKDGNPNDWSFDYGDFHFIGLNTGPWIPKLEISSEILTNSRKLTDEQIEFVKDSYQSSKVGTVGKNTFIFTHHPIVGHDGDWNVVDNRVDFVEWANSNKVEAVFSGHTHEDHKFGEPYPYKIGDDEGEINKPDEFTQNIVPFDWYTVYIETGSST